jgi:hypothetical protein
VETTVSSGLEQYPHDVSRLDGRVVKLTPLLEQEVAFRDFCRLLSKRIKATDESSRRTAIEKARDEIERQGNGKSDIPLKFACSVVTDVVAQGWGLSVTRSCVELQSPMLTGISREEVKRRIRGGHLLERDAQLCDPNVRQFIGRMEQRRLWKGNWVSILSLMRDGRELAEKLSVAAHTEPDNRLELLRSAIEPYLQLAEPDAVCEFTGIRLADIWRYFRHTWVSTYKSLPGRSMMILIRDAAAPFHPVIGIASLGSSMVQQTLRDEWIGWNSEEFIQKLSVKPTQRMSRWLEQSLKRLLEQIYVADFLREGIVTRTEIKKPTDEVIATLLQLAKKEAEAHRRFPDAADHKSRTNGNPNKGNWLSQASTPLFRSKRAKTLALLLRIRINLQEAGLQTPDGNGLKKALQTASGRSAVRQLVRLVKAEHVGIDMMDIVVCGAIAPYNVLLGGKLVCLLLMSPQVVGFYRRRYSRQESVIASSMRGKAVVRRPNLVLLATTSLYGVGSSQYNRVRVPLKEVGGKTEARMEYVELGVSKGYGSYHFSQASVDYLETLLGRAGNGRKVNSIFGEGVNPLIRKLREGLAMIGFPTNDLIKHGNPRLVYGVALAENFREILLGIDSRPKYFLPLRSVEKSTKDLADHWRKRWLNARINRAEILDAVSKHTLAYPISHGARVQLPIDEKEEDERYPLFQ